MPEPFDIAITRRVGANCTIAFEVRTYSVPFALVGEPEGGPCVDFIALGAPDASLGIRLALPPPRDAGVPSRAPAQRPRRRPLPRIALVFRVPELPGRWHVAFGNECHTLTPSVSIVSSDGREEDGTCRPLMAVTSP